MCFYALSHWTLEINKQWVIFVIVPDSLKIRYNLIKNHHAFSIVITLPSVFSQVHGQSSKPCSHNLYGFILLLNILFWWLWNSPESNWFISISQVWGVKWENDLDRGLDWELFQLFSVGLSVEVLIDLENQKISGSQNKSLDWIFLEPSYSTEVKACSRSAEKHHPHTIDFLTQAMSGGTGVPKLVTSPQAALLDNHRAGYKHVSARLWARLRKQFPQKWKEVEIVKYFTFFKNLILSPNV